MSLTEGLVVNSGEKVEYDITPGTKRGVLTGIERGKWPDKPDEPGEAYLAFNFSVQDNKGETVTLTKRCSLKVTFGGSKVSNLYKVLRALKPEVPSESYKEQSFTQALIEALPQEIPDGKLEVLLTVNKNDKGFVVIEDVIALPR